jgi:hypothetical protein
MVGTSQVYLLDEHRTLFVHVNEEGCTLATCDYITSGIDYDDEMVVDSVNISDLNADNKYFELYRDCFMEYVKKDCKYFKHTYDLPLSIFEGKLQTELPAEYISWHLENVGNHFEIDGEKCIMSEEYFAPDSDIVKAKQFLTYMNAEFDKWSLTDDRSNMEKFYDLPVVVGFGSKLLVLPNSAASYQALEHFVKDFIENY